MTLQLKYSEKSRGTCRVYMVGCSFGWKIFSVDICLIFFKVMKMFVLFVSFIIGILINICSSKIVVCFTLKVVVLLSLSFPFPFFFIFSDVFFLSSCLVFFLIYPSILFFSREVFGSYNCAQYCSNNVAY